MVAFGAGEHGQSSGIRQRGSLGRRALSERDFFAFGDLLGRNLDEALRSNMSVREFVDRDAVAGALRLLAGGISNRTHRGIEMFAVARKRQADEIALARGIVVAQAVVRKIAQLIVAEIENGDRLARASFLRAVSLVEQRRVTAVGANGDGRGKAVGAGKYPGTGRVRLLLVGR